jgi:hypothetical protein
MATKFCKMSDGGLQESDCIKTAKALNLTISEAFLLRADEVIE